MIKIGFVSATMLDNRTQEQIKTIEKYLMANKQCDLLVFGESYLQGFNGLTWNYDEDIERAVSLEERVISQIKELTRKYNTAVSFGLIERKEDLLYSTNVVIDSNGKIISVFRRLSKGWKEQCANCKYVEGTSISIFEIENVRFATAICGDLWDDEILDKVSKLEIDILLWPVYVDYSLKTWESVLGEYADRTKGLLCDVCFVNSFVEAAEAAKGGCYVFRDGEIVKELPLGQQGVLVYEKV